MKEINILFLFKIKKSNKKTEKGQIGDFFLINPKTFLTIFRFKITESEKGPDLLLTQGKEEDFKKYISSENSLILSPNIIWGKNLEDGQNYLSGIFPELIKKYLEK